MPWEESAVDEALIDAMHGGKGVSIHSTRHRVFTPTQDSSIPARESLGFQDVSERKVQTQIIKKDCTPNKCSYNTQNTHCYDFHP